jgi:hypothetical protein
MVVHMVCKLQEKPVLFDPDEVTTSGFPAFVREFLFLPSLKPFTNIVKQVKHFM